MNLQIGFGHTFEVDDPLLLIGLVFANVMCGQFDSLIKSTHSSERIFVGWTTETALASFDAAKLEPGVEDLKV
jgi:hypothetical protein